MSGDTVWLRGSRRVYRLLLGVYPRVFRSRFGAQLESTFEDALRDGQAQQGVRGASLVWLRMLVDLAGSAVRERWAALREWSAERRARPVREWAQGTTDDPSKRRGDPMGTLVQDVRYALRTLRRQPAFTLIAVVTLALGVGANTALFSVVRATLLAPLPYGGPGEVAMIWSRWEGFDKTWVSDPEFVHYRERLRSFDDIALYSTFEINLTEGDEPERVMAASVRPNMLDVLGVSPVLGRGFREEEAVPGPATVVLVSWELWQRRWSGDAGIVGGTLNVNGVDRTITGVLPEGLALPLDFKSEQPTEVWFPYALDGMASGALPRGGGNHGAYAVGRLAAGVTEAAANAELRGYIRELNTAGVYPPDMRFDAFVVTADNEILGKMKPALLVLLGAVGLVLLIACANVASLLVVRGEDRRRELGVRSAMGANGGRLVRQLLVENLVLAVAGGVLGVWVAWLGVTLVRSLAPASLSRVPDASIDGGVLFFTALVSLLTAAVFGLIPALQARRTDVNSVLKDSGRSATMSRARQRARQLLVAVEVALAIPLAVGAGLLLRSFWRLVDIDPGFRAENVLTMRLSTPAAFYPADADVTRFYTDLLTRVRALPGVEHAGLIRVLPIDQEIGDSCIQVDGYVPPEGRCTPADWQAASDGYFEALGLRLVAGRFIEATDTREAANVIVVNQAFVRSYYADGEALGKQVRFSFLGDTVAAQTVVGVVGDVRHNGITGPLKAAFYRPLAQWSNSTGFPQRSMALVVQATRNARALTAPVRAQIRELDPRLPVSSIQLMDDVLSRAVAQPRFTLVLLLAFGGLAIALSVVGIYGVVSYAVAARRDELGIRMALGAEPAAVVWLALRHGMAFAVGGVVAGTAVALSATRLLDNLVYELPTTDPLTYVAVALLGLAAALLASWIPAMRAARTDPATALRTR